MKRALIALITALPLVLGVTSAQADGFPGWPGMSGTPQVAVAGTVVSTSGTSIVANAYVVTPPTEGDNSQGDEGGLPGFGSFGFASFPGFSFSGLGSFGGSQNTQFRANDTTMPTPPTTTQVTIQTNTSTIIHIGGMGGDDSSSSTTPPTVSDLVAGTRFIALFPGSSTDPITTIVNNPATAIFAEIPKQFYAFVGTVTGTTAGTSTTPGSVTVSVSDSMPSGLFATGSSATFTVSGTMIIGGSGASSGFSLKDLFGGSLSNVSTGDMVTGGLIGPGGLTATQVESTPLMFLLDFPAPSASSSSSAAQKALKETMDLLHGGKVKLSKKHAKRSHHHSKRSKHSRRSARH